MSRTRDEQEMRNGVKVMQWIEHLTAHPDVPIDLDLVCYFNIAPRYMPRSEHTAADQ